MLDLYDDIMDIILDYLPVNDLLNASLVSKKWLEYIGESAAFRKKIVINSNFYTDPVISGKRKYECLNIRHHEMNSATLKLIKNHAWHTVYFNVQKVSSQNNFVGIIERLQHVRDLKVMNVAITKLKTHKKLSLSNLENLVFSDVAVDTFETFLDRQPELKSLSLRYITADILNKRTVREYVIEFLLLNNQLRQLELYPDVVNELFKSEVTQIVSLKLRSIALNLCDIKDAVIRTNIEDFLKSQENSLEELKFLFQQKFVGKRKYPQYSWYLEDEDSGDEEEADQKCNDISILFNVWNNLSCLKKLTLRFFVNFVENRELLLTLKNFKPNNSIKTLNIKHINCTIPVRTVEKIINLCPNLNYLYISNLDPSVITLCSQNLKFLKVINYSVEKDDAINVYDAAIKSANSNCNKFIKFHKEYMG
ncbi:uncharacterized protein [Chironomus tepperi]|uniref:uncharacterized protein n=1 Tax=Chironomus tepperi TaxID=113505 RepID=UPI00391F1D46